jgi:hypothetical protein
VRKWQDERAKLSKNEAPKLPPEKK